MNLAAPHWDAIRLASDESRPYGFFLADMPTEEGGLKAHSDRINAETTVALTQRILDLPQYKALCRVLPSERVAFFFEKRIHANIFPAIRSLCATEWFIQHGQSQDRPEVLWHDHRNLGPALQQVWPSIRVPLLLGAARTLPTRLRRRAGSIRRGLYRLLSQHLDSRAVVPASDVGSSDQPKIAVHFVDGLDLARRSDLFWYPRSNIDPGRILVYFDALSLGRLSSVEPVLQTLRQLGMNWVHLDERAGRKAGQAQGRKTGRRKSLLDIWRRELVGLKPRSPLERWFENEATLLLGEVERWLSFYNDFNVKVHVEVDESGHAALAQSIALDLIDGVHIGTERSDSLGGPGRHPNHAYFPWNQRGAFYAQVARNPIDFVIISGFPHDEGWRNTASTEELRDQLAARGASFVVAFFDSNFWWGGGLSKIIMESFYKSFLQWVLEDPQAGIITKSKRPAVLEGLPAIRELMAKAEATGRWINLTNVTGRLPSDASRVADISVGIGISSAITEAVAAGARGVHCDLSPNRSHPFYQWGYEKVVFDDLDRMMEAFKRHKAGDARQADLGDWSNNMDQADPYHDGKAGERVGTYLRWLLEAFDEGKDRTNSLEQASERYAASWGDDKVIAFGAPVETT